MPKLLAVCQGLVVPWADTAQAAAATASVVMAEQRSHLDGRTAEDESSCLAWATGGEASTGVGLASSLSPSVRASPSFGCDCAAGVATAAGVAEACAARDCTQCYPRLLTG